MRQNKKLLLNTISSIILQIIQIISGFILLVLIIRSFGSTVNGLIASINQFLAIISFMDMGVNLVVQSSYYKPLIDNDNKKLSILVKAASTYYHKLGIVIGIYCLCLAALYPVLINTGFGYGYVAILIFVMAISNFAQFFFGITYQNLIIADQRGFLLFLMESIIVFSNLILCYISIQLGASIHVVKGITVGLYLIKPFFQVIYVYKHFKIDRNVPVVKEAISGKKDGIALHISSVILNYTDPMVLTVLSTLQNVSVYSVYYGIINNVNRLICSIALNGFRPRFGELYVRDDVSMLRRTFSWLEWLYNGVCITVFGAMSILVSPFVAVYTKGINDAAYYQPVFGILLTLAYFFSCIVMPYHCMVSAAAHFKQTKIYYAISAILNVVISTVCVSSLGLIGVAIGTIVSMIFQMILLLFYCCKKLLFISVANSLKQFLVDILICIISGGICSLLKLNPKDYLEWFWQALYVLTIWIIISIIMNLIFYRKMSLAFIDKIITKIRKIKSEK